MSIAYGGMIGPSLDGVGSPATFTTDTLVTANTNASAKMIVIRGWATGDTTTGDSITVALSSAQPAFTSACFNPVGGTACYGTVPIYGLPNSNRAGTTPTGPVGNSFFFAAVVVPLVDLPAGATFSLTPTFGTLTKIFAVGELFTGTVQPPGTFASTTWDGSGDTGTGVVVGNTTLVMTTAAAVAADASMALTFQYVDTSSPCCLKCGSINALYSAGDAGSDGTWDAGSTDITWNDTYGTVFNDCHACIGYTPIRTRDYQVMLGHDSVTPSTTYTLTGQVSTPNAVNQCELGSPPTPDTRPRVAQRQTVFILRDHAPLACCPGAPPPFVTLEGEMSFQAGGDPIMGPGSIPPQQNPGSAMGKIRFEKA